MKEQSIGIGLVASAALTLGIGWANSAQAFSLNSSVTVTNNTRNVVTQVETVFEPPITKTVGLGLELPQFGKIWDIDLDEDSILFSLNSEVRQVISGDDIYRFKALDFGGLGQSSVTGFNVTYLGSVSFLKNPSFDVKNGNLLKVIFPLGFAPNPDLRAIPDGALAFRVDLTVKPPDPSPTPVPTPALLPGLVGLGLAALRRQQDGDRAA